MLLYLLACTGKNAGDEGISLSASLQSTLVCSATVSLEGKSGEVVIEFIEEGGELKSTFSSSVEGEGDLEVVGLKAKTSYFLRAVATLEDGTVLESAEAECMTGSLPDNLPEFTVEGEPSEPGAITILGISSPPQSGASYDMKLLWSFISKTSIEYAPLVKLSGFQAGKGRQPSRLESRKLHQRSI